MADRILIVEDYAPIRESIARGLQEASFAVDTSADGIAGIRLAESHVYDVIILDLVLPGLNGLEILTRLRAANCPSFILVLTAKDQLEDRLAGLNSGADDYLVKPFAFDELLARIRALARRKAEEFEQDIHIADLAIDTSRRTVRRAEKPIDLTAREYELLEFLARRAGTVVTRNEISRSLYDGQTSLSSNVVDVYIGYLRRKLENPSLPQLLHTVRGQGYVLGDTP